MTLTAGVTQNFDCLRAFAGVAPKEGNRLKAQFGERFHDTWPEEWDDEIRGQRLAGEAARGGDLVMDRLAADASQSYCTEAARFRDGGGKFGACHPSHSGRDDRILDPEKVANAGFEHVYEPSLPSRRYNLAITGSAGLCFRDCTLIRKIGASVQ